MGEPVLLVSCLLFSQVASARAAVVGYGGAIKCYVAILRGWQKC